MHDERAIRLARWVNAQHELCDLAPVGAGRFGVQQAQVDRGVIAVVVGELVAGGSAVWRADIGKNLSAL